MKIAFGTDAGGFAWDAINEAKEFSYETKFGMTPMQAIQTATRNAADLLDMSDRIGTIEAGKLADIVAVPGNPLNDITAMERVGVRDEGRERLQTAVSCSAISGLRKRLSAIY